ncbi:hypothetical protein PTKIN_Ptkin04bG0191400 [Pterospermum kingtungense]
MDVFIPEEYAIRRRIEKKAAGKRPNMVALALAGASKKMEKDNYNSQLLPPLFRLDSSEFLVPGGISENAVFSCLLSA